MKKLFLILPLGLGLVSSCGNSGETEVNNDALNEVMEDQDDFVEATISFEEGGATTGEEYFFGVQAEVVEIDVKLREIDDLDEMDALLSHIDSFKIFLKRQKNIGYHGVNYLNLINYTSKIIKTNGNKKSLEKIKTDIMNEKNVAEKEWLLEIC